MNREEIEKLIEETVNKERTSKKSISVDRIRNILNILFLFCALTGLILYFIWPDNRLAGMAVIGVGMCLKIAEFFLRFLF